MRVLCSTTAGDGHFGPLARVARACVGAGHDVLVAAPASFAGAVGRAGFAHAPFADVPPELIGPLMATLPSLSFDEANETVVREVFGRLDARYALPGVRAAVEEWRPDVILREPMEFGSLAAALSLGVPHVEVSIGLDETMRWAHEHLVAPLAELDALAGLPEGRLQGAMRSAPAITVVPAALDVAAPTPGPPGPSRPVTRYRAHAGRGTGRLPAAWGEPTDPLVYVSFGTVAAGLGHLSGLFEAALAALADQPVRVLMTTGHAGGVLVSPPWPANAHVEKYWPQDDVMPLAAAVVGHGGFGTTMSALAAGVPQVLMPLFTTDQRLNADRVAAVGAGVRVADVPSGVSQLSDAVTHVLADDRFRERAREMAAEIAALPEAAALVPEIERIAGARTGE
jgi:UDP:flavonoid glycosyltransferase YjiC (YdhE family)